MTKKHDKKEKSKKIKKKSQSKHKKTPQIYGEVVLNTTGLKAFADHLNDLVNNVADRNKFDDFVLNALSGVFNPVGKKIARSKFIIDIGPNTDPTQPMSLEVRITSVQMA